MKAYFLLPLTAAAFYASVAWLKASEGDVLASWSFEELSGTVATGQQAGPFGPTTGEGEFSGFHQSIATSWTTPVGNSSQRSLSANNWSVEDFFQVEVNTQQRTGVRISWDQTGSNTGPRDWELQYSTDGASFTTHVSYHIANDNWSSTTHRPQSTYTADLSSVAELNDQQSVIFRLVVASTTAISGDPVASTGTGRVDNFTVRVDAGPDGSGTAAVTNETTGSPYRNSAVFAPGEQQSVAITVTGTNATSLESVSITLPDQFSGLALGNVGLSGSAFSSANAAVAGNTITISNAEIHQSSSGTVIISSLGAAASNAITNYGSLEFTVKTASAAGALEEIEDQPRGNIVIPISLIRQVDEQGIPLAAGQRVAVAGVATVSSGVFHDALTGRFSTYLQDDTGGVALDHPSLADFWAGASAGNRYTAVGTVGQYRGLTQIGLPDQDAFIDHYDYAGEPESLVRTIAELLADAEDLEGTLVRIARASKTEGTWPQEGENAELTIMDAGSSSPLTLFINRFTDITWFNPEPVWPADIVGILTQYDTTSPFTAGYQILPRAYSDFLPASDPVTPEGGFAQWQGEFFPGADPSVSGPTADPDGDSIENLLEFALGANPHQDSRHLLPQVTVGGDFLQITFRRAKDAIDVVYTVEASDDLAGWIEIWSSIDNPYSSAEAVAERTVTDVVSLEAAPKRFLRLAVTLE